MCHKVFKKIFFVFFTFILLFPNTKKTCYITMYFRSFIFCTFVSENSDLSNFLSYDYILLRFRKFSRITSIEILF